MKRSRAAAQHAREHLLDMFSGGGLEALAHEAGIPNPALLTEAELRARLIGNWPHLEVAKRVALLLAAAGYEG